MCPKLGVASPPAKLKYYKNDLAPTGFYFDIFSTDLFRSPIMPLPMRIDRLTNGEATFFIIPNLNTLDLTLKELDLGFDLTKFYIEGLKNLITYAKRKYKEITYRELSFATLLKWFDSSINLESEIPSLSQDFYFLISEYLKIYADIENESIQIGTKEYLLRNLNYCESNLKYFKGKIENNKIQIIERGQLKEVSLYREKKGKYYPDIIPIEVENKKKNKVNKLTFVPYLIYDDLLDCFAYNKKLLDGEDQAPIDIIIWKNKGIINKRSNIEKTNQDFYIKNFKLSKITLEHLL
jgi:hypothetical protein